MYLYKRIENQIQPPTPVEKLIIRPETNDTLELDTQLALKLIRNDTGENCVNARYFVSLLSTNVIISFYLYEI